MNKKLIINRLNKCKVYQSDDIELKFDQSSSKISTSTKTQQSPTVYTINPQFTFKGNFSNLISQKKSKAQQFFQNLSLDKNQLIYQKVILFKPKPIQRTLQFELMSLFRQNQNFDNRLNNVARKLQYSSPSSILKSLNDSQIYSRDNIHNLKSNKRTIDENSNRNSLVNQKLKIKHEPSHPEYIKTQYVEPVVSQEYFNNFVSNKQNNSQYDSKKYQIQRQKSRNQLTKHNYLQRCRTEVIQSQYCYQNDNINRNGASTYNPQPIYNPYQNENDYNNITQKLDANNTKNQDAKNQQQNYINSYYFKESSGFERNQGLPNRERNYTHRFNDQSKNNKKVNSSSRLMIFRKQREIQQRRSLLQNNSYNNNCKPIKLYSSIDNKQKLSTANSNFKPLLPLNNLSKVAQKKLKNQFSQRYLLCRRYFQKKVQTNQNEYKSKEHSNSYLNKQTQIRLQSIRKQLKSIYQVKDKQKSILKLIRDQDIYDQNSKNSLRRVGSICKF